ncbi:MAG TPA: tRNA pseudouridine(54/55) synthase Pus10 [Candidatus Lokiarchaeia archaeon]|nr:tRNA pseudouridine(54/55) synthase Pus10 [Candidatus Lokiarchaeia archaeon]
MLTEIVKELLSKYVLCDYCLGRQFASLGTGIDNGFRGMTLRVAALLDAHGIIKEKTGAMEDSEFSENKSFIAGQGACEHPLAVKLLRMLNMSSSNATDVMEMQDSKVPWESDACVLCGGVFSRHVQDITVQMVQDKAKTIEFNSLLVGSRFSTSIMEKEEEMRVECGLKWGEAIKSNFNRFVGAELSKQLNKSVDFKSPDVVFVFNVENKDSLGLDIQINPLFIYGRYRKIARGIPQTHWPHRPCHGMGCAECNFTGKQYMESVEEYIAKPVLDATSGSGARFHGAGREDIDARMLGEGRPFVIEVLNSKTRSVDHDALAETINTYAKDKVEVSGLRLSTNQEMQDLKGGAPQTRKKYKAVCTLERPIDDETLEMLKSSLDGMTLHQQTPTRVLHRRSDRTRLKKVFDLGWERSENELEITFYIEAEGGTYIKELISSDEGRTQPSISGLANQQIIVKELDVLEVNKNLG